MKARGFTLIEMLVVLVILTILIGIVLAVGKQVQDGAQLAFTKSELKGLQGALQWYEHKTAGQMPTDMLSFLEGYQRLHAYEITSGSNAGHWAQHKNFLTDLPSSAVVMGTFPGPGAGTTQNMIGVIEILDGLGNPIQYVPPTNTEAENDFTVPSLYPYPCFNAGIQESYTISIGDWPYSTAGSPIHSINNYVTPLTLPIYAFTPTGINNLGKITSGAATGLVIMPLPSQVHAPCFFSFGTNYQGQYPFTGMNYTNYIYSYNP